MKKKWGNMIRDWKLLSVYACKEKEGGGDAGFDKVKKSSIATIRVGSCDNSLFHRKENLDLGRM